MIVTYATVNYIRWWDLLFSSCHITNPKRTIRAYRIGWENDIRRDFSIKDYEDTYPFVEFIDIPVTNETAERFTKITNIMTEDPTMPNINYFKTVIIFLETLRCKDFIYMDADTLVLKNFDSLFDKFKDYDFICTQRPGKEDRFKLYSGVMGFSAGAKMIEYAMRAMHICRETSQDQFSFYKALVDDMKVYSPTNEEHSINCNFDAMILSSKKMGFVPGKTKLYTYDEKYNMMKAVFEERFNGCLISH